MGTLLGLLSDLLDLIRVGDLLRWISERWEAMKHRRREKKERERDGS